MEGIAGCINKKGESPEKSINFKAISRLKEISEINNDDDNKKE